MTKGRPPRVCVIGAGIIGSWAALHLTEAGIPTTLIEQFPLPHTRGSSHGLSRAFRFLGDDTLDRLDYSLDRWQQLEDATGEPLLIKTGLLNFGPPSDPYLEKYMTVLKDGGRPFKWLDSDEIAAHYPTLRYPIEWGATWDPNGGILLAHRCLTVVQSLFKERGGRIATGQVTSIQTRANAGIRVKLRSHQTGNSDTLDFDRAVICAGPWTSKLLPDLSTLLQPVLIPVTYWHDPTRKHSVADQFPILFNARLTDVYCLPACEYPGLVKVIIHIGPEVDPETRDQASVSPFVEKVSRYVQANLPLLDHRKPAIQESCLYTLTPDSQPIIDRVASNLIVGCGFSGSGFKHSPATGKMLAAFVLEEEARLPAGYQTERYAFVRFNPQ